MKKVALLFITLLIAGICGCYAVPQVKVDPDVYAAISLYKQKNFTGAVQSSKAALKKNPDDVLAQYYLAISYVQLGMRTQALDAFNEVIKKGPENGSLTKISKQAVECYGDQTKCTSRDNIDDFVDSSEFVKKNVENNTKLLDAELKDIRDTINSGKDFDPDRYRYINDASDTAPTNEEIANAVKVLARAGFNPYTNMNPATYSSGASPKYAQLNALMGHTNAGDNSYANILPYLMAQGAEAGNNSKIDPRLLQSMMMNQTIQNFGFNNNNGNDRNY